MLEYDIMANKKKLDLQKIKTVSLEKRKSKVRIKDFASVMKPGGSFASFLDSLPDILAAGDFREIVCALKKAKAKGKPVVLMMGAHVIKCGLNPLIIDLMKKGYISAIAFNGAGTVHDFELAYCGRTSEDVEEAIRDGSFGMSAQTSEFYNRAVREAACNEEGLGHAFGRIILAEKLKHREISLMASAVKMGIPLTVHVAVGTDIVHMHPDCDGAALGQATMTDFKKFIEVVGGLEGGVVLNVGSAVIMPEVFLKAISCARNLGCRLNNFTAVCMDMVRHYRPMQNVVKRPTSSGGKGYYLVGHHEIMLPLLYRALLEE